MMKSPQVDTILQKIKQSTEKQRDLESQHVQTLSRLKNVEANGGNAEEDKLSLQSTLRELEKKIELETAEYEELMLELTLTKKHEKNSQQDEMRRETTAHFYQSSPATSLNFSAQSMPGVYTTGGYSSGPYTTGVYTSGGYISHTPLSSITSAGPSLPSTPVTSILGGPYTNNNLRDLDEVSAINNINAMLAQATSSIRNENGSYLLGLNGMQSDELKRQQMQLLEQGPKFVTDDEIERIKAKIEEDNRAIAALEANKYDPIPSYVKSQTLPATLPSPSIESKHTQLSEYRSEGGGVSSTLGSSSSPYIPSTDFSPLPPIRPPHTTPPGLSGLTGVYRPQTSAHTTHGLSGVTESQQQPYYSLQSTSKPFTSEDIQPSYYHSLASPAYESMGPSHIGHHTDPLENSNLCDILMLERALEKEAKSLGNDANRVDMLEIPGKGRCYVYLARYTYDPFAQSQNDNPEQELTLMAGDYLLVWGEQDEDGFMEAELMDGRRGLVPSNYITRLVGEDLMEFHQSVVVGSSGPNTEVADEGWSTSIPQDLPMSTLRDLSEQRILTPEPHLNSLHGDSWDEHQHLMHPMFLQSPDEIDLPPLDPVLLDHQRRRQQEDDLAEPSDAGAVPPPKQLTLERQLNKSILIGWNPPDCPPGIIEMYHVYVDGFLKTTVRASDKTRALVEGVDSAKPHRISVRSVTINRRTSRDAACTMIIGKDAPLGPSCVKATNVTSTSAVISWLPSNSNFQHTVSVNGVEVRAVKPGVYRHTITGLTPNTIYRVSIRAKNIKASPYVDEKSLIRLLEKLSAHTEFRTLNKGLPDPPMDVRVDSGPQDGTVLVTWIPVTLNTTSAKTKTAPVTGYAVFADGKRVTDVDSPSSDHALVDLACIGHFNPKNITVRSKSRDLLSLDSAAVPVPLASRRRGKMAERGGRMANGFRMGRGIARRGARRDISGQMVIDHDEDNLSDKETFSKNIPAIASDELYSDDERWGGGRGGRSASLARRRGGRGYSRDRGQSRIFVALFDYDPPTMSPNPENCDEELPFREGQLIKIIGEKDADGFYWGECGGLSGYVPCNMISEVQVDDERVARELLKDDQRSRGGRSGLQRDRWGDIYANTPTKKMIALYDYDPLELSPNVDSEVELSFRTGDIITVFGDMDDDGFYMAELRGQRGLVPSNFLTEAPGQYTGVVGGGGGVMGGGGMMGGGGGMVRPAFMQNGGIVNQATMQQMQQQQQQQQQQQPAKSGLMGGLFGGISKMTGVGAAATTAQTAAPTMTQPGGLMAGLTGGGGHNQMQMGGGGVGGNLGGGYAAAPVSQSTMMGPATTTATAPSAAAAIPPVVNLDRIPGLDDDIPPQAPAPTTASSLLGGLKPPGAAAPGAEGGGGGLLGGLTGGLQSGLGGLTGAASGVTGKLGDLGGSATGAAGSLLSGGKGLFKKFGF